MYKADIDALVNAANNVAKFVENIDSICAKGLEFVESARGAMQDEKGQTALDAMKNYLENLRSMAPEAKGIQKQLLDSAEHFDNGQKILTKTLF